MSKPTKPYHHGNLKQTLVDGALAQLNAGRIGELSLRQVARDVGVSPNAPYRHFKTREDLLASLAAHGFTRLKESMDSIQEQGPMKRYRALGEAFHNFARENSALFRLMFNSPLPPEREELVGARTACYSLVLDGVRGVMGENEAAENVSRGARASWSLFYGYAFLSLDNGFPSSATEPPEEARDIARILGRGLRD